MSTFEQFFEAKTEEFDGDSLDRLGMHEVFAEDPHGARVHSHDVEVLSTAETGIFKKPLDRCPGEFFGCFGIGAFGFLKEDTFGRFGALEDDALCGEILGVVEEDISVFSVDTAGEDVL